MSWYYYNKTGLGNQTISTYYTCGKPIGYCLIKLLCVNF